MLHVVVSAALLHQMFDNASETLFHHGGDSTGISPDESSTYPNIGRFVVVKDTLMPVG